MAEYHPQRIAKNATFLTAAYVIQKLFSFVYFIFVARMIGVDNVGKYIFALSFTTIFSVFIDLGLSSVLTRETAKDQSKSSEYLNNILGVKILLSLITYFVAAVLINVLDYSSLTKSLVYIAGLIMVVDSFNLSFYAVLRGYQNLKFESIGIVIGQAITVSIGLTGLFLKFPLYILIIALLGSSLFNFLLALFVLEKKIKIKPGLVLDEKVIYGLFKIALPFGIAAIFTRVYGYIDSVILSMLAGDKAVGWYGVAYKLTFALQFVPAAFAAAIFPAMSSYYACSKELLAKTFEKSMFYLMIISVPISFGVLALSDKIILKIYGVAYAPAIIPLEILICSLVFIFLNFPIGSLLNACDYQTKNTINLGIAMVINIILNIILIPKYSYIGASIASIVSSALLFALGLHYVPKIIEYNKNFLYKVFFKTLFASILMASWIVYLLPKVNFLVLIPIGALIYVVIMLLIGGFKKHDIIVVYEALVRKFE
jgi:O-antigen/teichoic acid export membrane protein